MPFRRRDFMKLFGVSVASLVLNRGCIPFTPTPTCYAPTVPPVRNSGSSAREHLREYWLSFPELAEKSRQDNENRFGEELVIDHQAALNELILNGEISGPVADLVQEAYKAAVYHVWRSNVNITCYAPVMIDYAPSSASVLVDQATVLNQIAEQGTVNPDTLTKAQAALEHDMAFYALTDEEVQALHAKVLKESSEAGQPVPSFEALTLELTPEAKAATQFIIDLLTSK